MGAETNQGAGNSLLKSGRSIQAAGNELQNLDRVEARREVIGHDAVSRIEYSSDEPAVKYRGTWGDRIRFRHDHLQAPGLALVSSASLRSFDGRWVRQQALILPAHAGDRRMIGLIVSPFSLSCAA